MPWYNWNIVESGIKHHKPTFLWHHNIISKPMTDVVERIEFPGQYHSECVEHITKY